MLNEAIRSGEERKIAEWMEAPKAQEAAFVAGSSYCEKRDGATLRMAGLEPVATAVKEENKEILEILLARASGPDEAKARVRYHGQHRNTAL